jgi:putative aldouronate transport system permease protein
MAKRKSKKKFKFFPIINGLIFVIVCLFILIPMWKVFVDSLDVKTSYGMRLWPKEFGLTGYKVILTYATLYKPFLISVITTIAGTFVGLTLSTLGAYVLVQFKMPGRNLFSFLLLFTMIFSGGMIPSFLVMQKLNLIDSLFAVILPLSMNVYNLVLMRNFFEGIPQGLFEAASIDGCSPIGTFFKIVLPLSKAALASIGLMFAVGFWNDYTNFKIYIQKSSLYNFQQKLRNVIMDGDTPNTQENISQNTMFNAAVMVAIIPFIIIYPFCQKYFVKGVNIGAVKE